MKTSDFPCRVTFFNKKLDKYAEVLFGFKSDYDTSVKLAKSDGYSIVKHEKLKEYVIDDLP